MRIYHFTRANFALEAVSKRRLKIARLNELNDPFEFMTWASKDRGFRIKLKQWKDFENLRTGILCFSRKWHNPLLWAHYADNHRGIALGFSVPDDTTYNPVRYVSKRPTAPIAIGQSPDRINELILTKFEAWKYEDEYRCFCLLHDSIFENDLYFEPFSQKLKLTEIILGHKCSISPKEIKESIHPSLRTVNIFRSRPAFQDFSVVRDLRSIR